jgi:hypothetical protein
MHRQPGRIDAIAVKASESCEAASLAAVAKQAGVATARTSQMTDLRLITDEQLEGVIKHVFGE